MERLLAEVVASQAALIRRLGSQPPALSPEAMELALEAHLKQVKAALRLRPEMRVCWIGHREAIQDASSVCKTLQEFLGIPLNLPRMAAQVDPSLYRERKPDRMAPASQL